MSGASLRCAGAPERRTGEGRARRGAWAAEGGERGQGESPTPEEASELRGLERSEVWFWHSLTTHVKKAAESGGLRTEGPPWVQFC